jgi:hypothetical protein
VLQEQFLAECIADLLIVTDCCNALSAMGIWDISSPVTAMLWAACDHNSKTPESGPTFLSHRAEGIKETR